MFLLIDLINISTQMQKNSCIFVKTFFGVVFESLSWVVL